MPGKSAAPGPSGIPGAAVSRYFRRAFPQKPPIGHTIQGTPGQDQFFSGLAMNLASRRIPPLRSPLDTAVQSSWVRGVSGASSAEIGIGWSWSSLAELK